MRAESRVTTTGARGWWLIKLLTSWKEWMSWEIDVKLHGARKWWEMMFSLNSLLKYGHISQLVANRKATDHGPTGEDADMKVVCAYIIFWFLVLRIWPQCFSQTFKQHEISFTAEVCCQKSLNVVQVSDCEDLLVPCVFYGLLSGQNMMLCLEFLFGHLMDQTLKKIIHKVT